ncbi:DUF4405 domain-containing protein [Saccharophagus sp. K07]|uniref:DUF4405 domain-containing protein n=1 Tax=Saccharophagus sp. K07 TaxID=2283636 RepID=UPI00165253E3|nr:DUF4405 domain-containing protein [Saccharophagus sp. K07]MBC6906318.1 DUF4405 domain-containing protein [Saccharophagus sp. K07]
MKAAKPFTLRTWSTPITIGSFILMTVTGVLMFFDVVPGYLSFAHEWFSWIFIIGAAGHMVINFKPLTKHLRSNWGRGSVAIFSMIVFISTFSFGHITAPQLKWPISYALIDAPLSALADVTRTDHTELLQKLKNHGITATLDQNIRELAIEQNVDEFHMLGLVFLLDSSTQQ